MGVSNDTNGPSGRDDQADAVVTTREELLSAYASGCTSPGLSLLCAAHLTLSPKARRYMDGLDELGGAMLASDDSALPESACAPPSLDAMLARLDAEEAQAAPALAPTEAPRVDAGPLPLPVARAVGVGPEGIAFKDVPWRFRLPGISEYVLDGFEGEKVSLMRARPGARVPNHTHEGVEATLVLAGAMKDGATVLTPGDVALCGSEHDHHPEIVGDETCFCLIVVDGGLRFTGRFGRALNLFAE